MGSTALVGFPADGAAQQPVRMQPAATQPAPPPSDTDSDEVVADKRRLSTIAMGPTLFTLAGTHSTTESLQRPGLALDLSSQHRLHKNFGFGLRFAWGLTEFRRVKTFGRHAYNIGRWTTHAYRDMWCWATEDDTKTGALRVPAAFIASVFLWMPYVASAATYVAALFSPTTYLELDALATFDFDDGGRRMFAPYLKAGVGFAAFLHPRTDRLLGGLGPSAAVGARISSFDLSLKSTFLPRYLHGEQAGEGSHIVLSGFTIGYVH